MAAVKENVKVLAGTFPIASSDLANKKLKKLREEQMDGFAIKTCKEMPEHIQVIETCKDKEEAEALIKKGKEKGINLCIAK